MMTIPSDPKLQKALAEEHQREILEDIEANKLARGKVSPEEYDSNDYQPITDGENDSIPTRRENRHIHKK